MATQVVGKFKWLVASLVMLLAACGADDPHPKFFVSENPNALSEWGAVSISNGALTLGEGVVPYAINSPLFTDYAHKLRTIWTTGGTAVVGNEGQLDFPVGTVITKTFYYPSSGNNMVRTSKTAVVNASTGIDVAGHRLLETRLLVRRADGWHPISYVWNEEQTEAYLKRTGAVIPLTLENSSGSIDFHYVAPGENQCASCHAPNAVTKTIQPLGPTLSQLDRSYSYAGGSKNQLAHLAELGLLGEPEEQFEPIRSWLDQAASVEARARSYLASNCAHCHSPVGPARTSGLDLRMSATGPESGRCKPPIAAGSGTGGFKFDINPGHAEQSIMVYRMATTDPGAMMPEIGRTLVHDEGVEIVSRWIDAMDGSCS